MALDLLLHVLVLHHIMQFRNFYLVFLSVSQCYATLELKDFLEISRDWRDIVSSRDPPDLKKVFTLALFTVKDKRRELDTSRLLSIIILFYLWWNLQLLLITMSWNLGFSTKWNEIKFSLLPCSPAAWCRWRPCRCCPPSWSSPPPRTSRRQGSRRSRWWSRWGAGCTPRPRSRPRCRTRRDSCDRLYGSLLTAYL